MLRLDLPKTIRAAQIWITPAEGGGALVETEAEDESPDAAERDAAQIMTLINQSATKLRGMVAGAGVGGRTLTADRVANEVEKRTMAELSKSSTAPANEATKKAVATLKADFVSHPDVAPTGRISFEKAHQFAQSAGQEIQPKYVRMADGQLAELPTDPVRRIWKAKENDVLQEALGHPAAVGPDYAATNAQTSKLIAAKNAMWPEVDQMGSGAEVVRRGIPLATTLGGAAAGEEVGRRYHTPGGPIGGALAGALLGSPAGMSTLALILSNPALYAALRAGPQAAGGMLSAHQ